MLFTSGVTIISYKGYAEQKGWPIGSLFRKGGGIIDMLGFLTTFGTIIASFFYIKWYIIVVGIIIGWLASGLITAILRVHTQVFTIILFIISYFLLMNQLINK